MRKESYSDQYYSTIAEGSLRSAKEVIPVILQFISPASVADVGCGLGAWLSVWQKHGVTDLLGIDGDYVDRNKLKIARDKFIPADLEKGFALPRTFNLVMSLEVAEHIRPEFALSYVGSLCKLGNVILFSAAIPGQGGVNHFNEQYPSYWTGLFKKFGFTGYDCIRAKIWMNSAIDPCYRQNLLFFVKDDEKDKYRSIAEHTSPVLPLVHPDHFDQKEYILHSYKKILRTPFHTGWYFLKRFAGLFKRR